MATLLIIRHALAAAPGDHRLPGPDLALLPAGEDQARRLASRLHDFRPAAVYTSDARRARQTGEIIAAACRAPRQVIPALREIDVGVWAGRTYAEIAAADPPAAAWFSDPSSGIPPGGESIAAAADRVLQTLHALATPDAGRVAIVGHAGSLRLAIAQALAMPLSSYWRLRLDCASLSVMTWTTDGPLLERLNDTTHLESAVPGQPRTRRGNCTASRNENEW